MGNERIEQILKENELLKELLNITTKDFNMDDVRAIGKALGDSGVNYELSNRQQKLLKSKNPEKVKKAKNLESRNFKNLKELENELKKIEGKKKTNVAKFRKDSASCFTSNLTTAIIQNFKSRDLSKDGTVVIGEEKKLDIGTIRLDQEIAETNKSYIFENYQTIRFSREELQIYLAVLNVYMQNINKKNWGVPFEFSIKDFHMNVLGRKNRLRKTDLERYENIFEGLGGKRIRYNPEITTIAPYNKKEFKGIRINSPLIHVDIVILNNYKEQVIRVIPSTLTMLEFKSVRQISNYLPIEVIQLRFDKSDNIFYFLIHIVKMHRNNESYVEKTKGKKPKRIYPPSHKKEFILRNLIIKALPNHEEILLNFEESTRKKEFFNMLVLMPLKETLEIYKNHGYIDKNYKIPDYSKNVLDEKVEVIFNYDITKLKKLKK